MITQRRHQWRSFAGGELSEEMYGRADLPRHAIGLKRCYNAVVTPQGAVENRAGSKFIATTNNNQPAWLIPFVRSDGQGFLLEFGDQYARVIGGGNIVGDEPDPANFFDVTNVDIWVAADGTPVTPVVFTTGVANGFVAGDAIRFQGFTLENPDQAGNNRLAEFMNTTWFVAEVLSATQFTISLSQTPPVAYALLDAGNLSFEDGDIGWIKSVPIGDAVAVIENLDPTNDGTWRARLEDPTPGSDKAQSIENSTFFPTAPGRTETVRCRAQCFSDHDETRAYVAIHWYDSTDTFISATTAEEMTLAGTANINGAGVIGTSEFVQNLWGTLTIRAEAPALAASFRPAFIANFQQEGGWYADSFTVGFDARATWSDFSNAPYNGLVNGGTVALSANVTAITLTPPYSQSHIRFASYAQFVDDLIIAHKIYPTARLTRLGDNDWSFTNLVFNVSLLAPTGIIATAQGSPGTPAITYTYTVTTVDDDGAESSLGTPDSADNTLRTLGNFNTIDWNAVPGSFRFNVYKDIGGSVFGFIGSATGITFTDDNIEPDFTKQAPEILATFDVAGDYPGTVSFHEQRMVLAGTVEEPQAFWVSGLASFDYFKASVPPQDDQAFTYELMSLKAAPIIHSLALHELLFFTSAGVQRITPVDTELFGPATIAARPVVSYGAHELAKPQEAGTNILYPGERGGHLYQMTPAESLAGYDVEDLSIIAAHLIPEGKDWVQTAFRRAPFPIWFGLRNDGIIIALTYMPEQHMFAWHQHELPGAFIESIAVVPEGKKDSLYVIARRTILDGEVRYIERIEPRAFVDQVDAFFVDSGVTQRGGETNLVTGLDHLEGEEVMALADGRVLGPYTVSGGEITIDDIAAVIHVGLAYRSEVETLPLSYVSEAGYGVGIMKNVSQVWLRLKQALGLTAGVSFEDDDQRPLVDDAEELLGDVPALRDGVHDVNVTPVWEQDTTICLLQTQPLPFTVTGMALDYVDG